MGMMPIDVVVKTYVVLCCLLLSYVVLCCLMLCYVVLCCAVLSYVALFCLTLCYVVLRCVCCLMLCYVVLRCTVLSYVALCCAFAKFYTGRPRSKVYIYHFDRKGTPRPFLYQKLPVLEIVSVNVYYILFF